MNLGELFVQIGTIGNSKEVKAFGEAVKKAGKAIDDFDKKRNKANDGDTKFNATLKGTIGAVAGVIGGLAAAYWALDRLTNSLAKQNQQWLNLTRQSDIALSTFQKWGTIGKIVGVDNAAQQLENLNQKIFNLRLTGEGAKGFQMAGIMPTTAENVLEQLRSRISGMSNTTATYLLQQMGLDPKMITLLRMGRQEWEQYLEVSRRYTLTKDQRESIEFYNRQLEVTRIKMQYLKDRVILSILPAFTRFTKTVISAVEGVKSLIKTFIDMNNPIANLAKGLIKIQLGLAAVGLALMAITAHPIIAGLTALIGAIMLIADDVNHYLNGGGSVIGVIAKGLEDLNLKGFIDFPVPKWLEYLIRVIDFFSGNASRRAVETRIEDAVKNIDPEALKLPNGSYAEIPPEFLNSAGASNITTSNNTTNNNTTNSPQVTVFTSADTLKDIYNLPYLRTISVNGL